MKGIAGRYRPPERQPEVILDQAAPVQNTWYTFLITTTDIRLYGGTFRVATANETIEIELTIDGVTLTSSTACTANTVYNLQMGHLISGTVLMPISGTALEREALGFPYDGHSMQIRIRKTTATGAGTLTFTMDYALFR